MSDLGELLEKAEIKFPRSIELGEAKSLMMLLAEKLPAAIDYSYTMREKIDGLDEKPGELRPIEHYSHFGASMMVIGDGTIVVSFKLERGPVTEGLRYDSLKFEPIIGYRFKDHTKQIGIWNNVRALIEEYFSQGAK